MRLPIITLLVAIFCSQLATAQKFYVGTLDNNPPYLSKTLVMDLANCDTVEIYTCPPTEDTGSWGQGQYTDMAFDHKQNLWYVTAKGNLYRRNVNNDSSCEYIGNFTGAVNALVADDGDALYAAGSNGKTTTIYKFEYKEGANSFKKLGQLPSDWQSSGDLFFYEHRLFLSCFRINHKPHFLVEVTLPDPSSSCYYMSTDDLNIWGAFSVKTPQGSKAYALNVFQGNKSTLAEIDIPNKKVLTTMCNYPYMIGGAATYYDLVDDTTTCVTDTPVSVTTVRSTINGIRVHNPSVGYLRINTNINSNDIKDVSLYDLSGRGVKTFSKADFPARMDIAEMPAGLYMLRLRLNSGQIWQDRVVISSY